MKKVINMENFNSEIYSLRFEGSNGIERKD